MTPWILVVFDKKLQKIWRSNPYELLASVTYRRKRFIEGLEAPQHGQSIPTPISDMEPNLEDSQTPEGLALSKKLANKTQESRDLRQCPACEEISLLWNQFTGLYECFNPRCRLNFTETELAARIGQQLPPEE